MAANPCDQWHHMCEPFVPHGQAVIHVKFRLDLFSYFREEDFWRFFFCCLNQDCQITWPMTSCFFFVAHFIPIWPSKIFILIGCGILHMQLWCHNEGPDDVIKKPLIPHEEYLPCAKFQFFLGAVSEIQRYSVYEYLFPVIFPKFFQYSCHSTWPMTS